MTVAVGSGTLGRTPTRTPACQHRQPLVHLDGATLNQASERIAMAMERKLRGVKWRGAVISSGVSGTAGRQD